MLDKLGNKIEREDWILRAVHSDFELVKVKSITPKGIGVNRTERNKYIRFHDSRGYHEIVNKKPLYLYSYKNQFHNLLNLSKLQVDHLLHKLKN